MNTLARAVKCQSPNVRQKEAHAKATQRQLETDKQKNDQKKKDAKSKKGMQYSCI